MTSVLTDAMACKCSRFSGKVVVITGSTAGIGESIAERVGLEGAQVVICSRKQKSVDATLQKLRAQGIDCVGRVCHVGNADDRRALIQLAVQVRLVSATKYIKLFLKIAI